MKRNTLGLKQGKFEGFDSCDRPSNRAQIWPESSIFQPAWPWNLMDNLEGTSSILHQALCITSNPSGNSNWSYSPETLNSGQNWRFFLSRVTLKFDGWPSKTIGHLFYTLSSFVHHSKAMVEFKLELQSGNAQFGLKSAIFLSRVTLKFHGWPWKNNRALLLYCCKRFVSVNSN